MEFATGALGTLLPKLGQLLKDEYNLQKGVKKNIESVRKELEFIQAALRSVGELPPEQLSELVKLWAREARELSYDMEDIVDTFLVRAQGPEPPSKRSFKRFVKKISGFVTKAKTQHEIGKDIKDVKERVEELAARRDRYKSADAYTPTKVDPLISSLYPKATNLVGIDEAREELIMKLTKGDEPSAHQRQRILSVVGIGGLGKTTLSKSVYDKLKGQFDCSAFVPVGRNPDLKKVFKDILINLHKERYMHFNFAILDEQQLSDELQDFLGNKRYFIVIDDVWDTQSWGIIKSAFDENNSGSRIIITTRTRDVAMEAGEVYKLQPLSDDNSRKLFFARIFGGENKSFDHRSDEVSDKILRKCGGVPLAIITMASLLVGKPRQEWSDVHRSIGFGNNKENREVKNTMKIISFSYYDLPSHLKSCLLHLSVFPEDYLIPKSPLIWMWIAEGFIHKQKGMSLFDIGEGYFNELINRSLIQEVVDSDIVVEPTRSGCRVHDMVLDLIRSISSEMNFITVLDNNEGVLSQGKARRLALHNDRTLEAYGSGDQAMGMQQLRSFISCHGVIIKENTLLSFKLVRVLYIDTSKYFKRLHLEHLRNLLHLRYLRVSGGGTSVELPQEIGTLKFLQTLDVEGYPTSNEVVTRVGHLTELLCLRFINRLRNVPDGIEKLTSLEELGLMFYQCSDELWRQLVKQLGSMGELRMLNVQTFILEDVDTKAWEAGGFLLPQNLQQLFLEGISFSRFPSFCINPSRLPILSDLTLRLNDIDEQDMRILGRLPELRFLELRLVSFMQVACNASTDATGDECFFQKLRRCRVKWGSSFLRLPPGFSAYMWDADASMLLGSEREDAVCSSGKAGVSPTLMPSLQELWFFVQVREFKDDNRRSVALEYFASLQNVSVIVHCSGASAVEVEEVEAGLRHAADVHPNRPTLEMKRNGTKYMISTVQDQEHTGATNDDAHEACMSVVEINPQGDGS